MKDYSAIHEHCLKTHCEHEITLLRQELAAAKIDADHEHAQSMDDWLPTGVVGRANERAERAWKHMLSIRSALLCTYDGLPASAYLAAVCEARRRVDAALSQPECACPDHWSPNTTHKPKEA